MTHVMRETLLNFYGNDLVSIFYQTVLIRVDNTFLKKLFLFDFDTQLYIFRYCQTKVCVFCRQLIIFYKVLKTKLIICKGSGLPSIE